MTTLSTPAQSIEHRWQTPSPHWGIGVDPRSSENGLFTLFYASLERASHYSWLNAGRTLIDKTYLSILCQAHQINMQGIQPTELANRLDQFIRSELVPRWQILDELDHEARHQLALELLEQANSTLFEGYPAGQSTSSHILFYLCPQLPFFPLPAETDIPYPAWHNQCRSQLAQLLPQLTTAPGTATYGDNKAQAFTRRRLQQGDWWQRWLFIQQQAP